MGKRNFYRFEFVTDSLLALVQRATKEWVENHVPPPEAKEAWIAKRVAHLKAGANEPSRKRGRSDKREASSDEEVLHSGVHGGSVAGGPSDDEVLRVPKKKRNAALLLVPVQQAMEQGVCFSSLHAIRIFTDSATEILLCMLLARVQRANHHRVIRIPTLCVTKFCLAACTRTAGDERVDGESRPAARSKGGLDRQACGSPQGRRQRAVAKARSLGQTRSIFR